MSLINREELLRRLKLHGRRRDGKTVTPEWMQVAIKEVEHMPSSQQNSVAYWQVGSDVDNVLPKFPEDNGWGIWYCCTNCGHAQHSTPGQCPKCQADMANGEHLRRGNAPPADMLTNIMVYAIIHRLPESELLRIHRGATPK